MVLRNFIKGFLSILLTLALLSVVVPLHNILHKHSFVNVDICGSSCKKHLKDYPKPCCTTSDAIFLSELPNEAAHLIVNQPFVKLENFVNGDSYFQFFHLTKNKAPPLEA